MTYSNEEVVAVVDTFLPYLISTFKIRNYDKDDLKQEAYKKAFEVMQKGWYNENHTLNNYLFMAVRNHLKNMVRRERVSHSDGVCPDCEGGECRACYLAGQTRSYKESAKNPSCLHEVDLDYEGGSTDECDVLDQLGTNELINILHSSLNGEVRTNFIKMVNGIPVKPEAKRSVQVAVATILISKDFDIDYIDLFDYLDPELEDEKEREREGTD